MITTAIDSVECEFCQCIYIECILELLAPRTHSLHMSTLLQLQIQTYIHQAPPSFCRASHLHELLSRWLVAVNMVEYRA
jgi:hypothetical protein